MPRVKLQSSLLSAVTYSIERKTLKVEFTHGEVYLYTKVPLSVYQDLVTASSKGRFFNSEIRDGYPYERQTPLKSKGASRGGSV
jgi:lysyl-tRNA synthetase class 2